ncbi:MAG: hypothetical protein WCS37_20360 [Chloroflexota bacterium]|nr:hypothetical protein [Chloroflexota bacterium]
MHHTKHPDDPFVTPVAGRVNCTRLKPTRWYAAWHELDPQRLSFERKAMANKFPSFHMHRMQDGRLAWSGTLQSNRGNAYKILLVYPVQFPYKPPLVYPIEPTIEAFDPGTDKYKHQYPDGHLCLYFPGDRDFDVKTTAATVVAVSAAWFFAYESWLESGRREWPGPEVDHNRR